MNATGSTNNTGSTNDTGPTNDTDLTVRPIAPTDEAAWRELFHDYRTFYKLAPSDEIVSRVWEWLNDPAHESRALVAETADGLVAIAHYRTFARPIAGGRGIWLDDLFTSPLARGKGAAGALIARLQRIADAEGATLVRWITAEDNDRARALYDRVATQTLWVTYDAAPAAQ